MGMDQNVVMLSEQQATIYGIVWLAFFIVFGILAIVTGWKIFVKAGEPGWGILIPIYNMVIICRIGGRPGWWAILYFIPVIWFVPAVLVPLGMAKNFGKGIGFAIALMIPPIAVIPWLMLAFGDVQFSQEGAAS